MAEGSSGECAVRYGNSSSTSSGGVLAGARAIAATAESSARRRPPTPRTGGAGPLGPPIDPPEPVAQRVRQLAREPIESHRPALAQRECVHAVRHPAQVLQEERLPTSPPPTYGPDPQPGPAVQDEARQVVPFVDAVEYFARPFEHCPMLAEIKLG